MKSNSPIGIIDSGIGGTTVLVALLKLLPNENFIYLGDTRYLPYGNKSESFIRRRSKELGHFLGGVGVKLLVVACHTISAYSVKELRRDLKMPIVSMIESAFQLGVGVTKNKNVMVLGTENLVHSGAYDELNAQQGSPVQLLSKSCPELATLIESNQVTQKMVDKETIGVRESGADTVLLACTHYSIVKSEIELSLPDISIVDPAWGVAARVKQELVEYNLLRQDSLGSVEFLFTEKRRGKQGKSKEEIIKI